MKSFAVTIVIFCALLGVIVWNYFYVTQLCEELEQKIEDLPVCEDASGAVTELRNHWEENTAVLGISTSHLLIGKMNECLTDLQYAADRNDTQIFERSRYLAQTILTEIKSNEALHIENWI